MAALSKPPRRKPFQARPELIEAVIQQESQGDPNAVSSAGAVGLMQLMPRLARAMGVTDPKDPVQNVRGGTRYLNLLLNQFDGDEEKALSAYHSGPARVGRLIKAGTFPGGLGPIGRRYAPEVLERAKRPPKPKRRPELATSPTFPEAGNFGSRGVRAPRPGGPASPQEELQPSLLDQIKTAARRLEQARIPGAPEQAPVTTDMLMGELRRATTARPGMFKRRFGQPIARVGEAAAAGFEKGFGPGPVTGVPVPGPLGPLITGPTALGEAAFRGLSGTFQGGLEAFEQSLVELGVSETGARRATRDLAGVTEVTGIITGGRPLLFPGVRETARRMGRKLTFATKFDEERAAIQEAKASRAQARAINRARMEARERARPGTPEAEIRDAAVVIAGRRLDDVKVRATSEALLRAPDEIINMRPPLKRAALPLAIQKQAIKAAQDILVSRGIPPNSLTPARVQQLVADLLNTDDAFSVRLFADIEASGMSKVEFIRAFTEEGSEAARSLRARRDFWNTDPVLTAFRERALKGDTEAARVVREVVEGVGPDGLPITPGLVLTPLEASAGALAKTGRLFRKLIISLPATATRNFIDSGGFRLTLTAANQAIDQTLRRVFTPGSPELEPVFEGFNELAKVFGGLIRDPAARITRGRLKPSRSKQLIDRLTTGFPKIKGRAFASLNADVSIRAGRGGFEAFTDKYLLALNRAQEFIIRRAVLSSRLDVELKKIGSSLEEVVDQGRIPAGFNDALALSIDKALELTFALPPGGQRKLNKLFKNYADLIEESRALVFLEPFPRFIFNATKLIMENTATAGLRLMRPINRAKIAEGDFSPFAREMTGTALMATAYAIRQGDFPGLEPGARFDEVIGAEGNRLSMGPFATVIPHLFLADLIIRLDEGRIQASTDQFKEFRRGLLSSAPQAGRAASTIEEAYKALLGIDTMADFTKLVEFGTETVGTGMLRPLTLLRDFRGEWNEAVAIQRETRGQGGLAPLTNVFAPEMLPERESPTRAAPPTAPRVTLPFGLGTVSGPLFSQVGGAPVREPRNEIEREIVFQGFTGKQLSPKTGSKRTDALVNRFSGPVLELVGRIVVTSDLYKRLPTKSKQEVLRNVINLSREPGLALAKRSAPAAFELRKIERMPSNERAAIEEQLDQIFTSSGLNLKTADLMKALEAAGSRELENLGL